MSAFLRLWSMWEDCKAPTPFTKCITAVAVSQSHCSNDPSACHRGPSPQVDRSSCGQPARLWLRGGSIFNSECRRQVLSGVTFPQPWMGTSPCKWTGFPTLTAAAQGRATHQIYPPLTLITGSLHGAPACNGRFKPACTTNVLSFTSLFLLVLMRTALSKLFAPASPNTSTSNPILPRCFVSWYYFALSHSQVNFWLPFFFFFLNIF